MWLTSTFTTTTVEGIKYKDFHYRDWLYTYRQQGGSIMKLWKI